MKPTRLNKQELFPDKLSNSFLNRAKNTIDFIESVDLPSCDCGEDNPLKRMIKDHFNKEICSYDVDFDYEKMQGRYKTVFCFELLEHLYNPLFFLNNIKNMLLPDGIIYLSTPYQRPQLLKSIHHFHEIPDDRLMWLFNEAGLKILKQKRIAIAGNWYDHIHGIRPILRYFQKTRIYKLCAI